MAVHYYRPEFTEAQAKSQIQDMVHDLAEFSIADIEKAIALYRQTPPPAGRVKYFPDSGTLRKLCNDERKHRVDMEKAPKAKWQFGEPRPNMWWLQRRELWKPHWRDSEIPRGELYKTAEGKWVTA